METFEALNVNNDFNTVYFYSYSQVSVFLFSFLNGHLNMSLLLKDTRETHEMCYLLKHFAQYPQTSQLL